MARQLTTIGAILLALLTLGGCYKTELPSLGYRYGLPVPEIHIVQRGDTLFAIGRRYNIDYHTLIRRNHIRPPYTIYVGQRIYLTHAAPKPANSLIPKPRHPPVVAHRKPSHHRKRTAHKARKPHRRQHATRKPRPRKRSHYASAHHQAVASVPLRWPASGSVTSGFGLRGSRMHDGIDIGAKPGSPVVAAAGGTVVYSDNRLSGYGNLIIIRHRKNLFTAYAHNQVNLVHQGEAVRSGQIIAKVGNTGRATGPHLHFEVRRGTTPVDPLLYLPKR